jgi:heterodisulfide reductase subunit A
MYSLKLAHLVREMLDADVVEFYRDMRTFGKSYESFYKKVREDGVKFIRYRQNIHVSGVDSGLIIETVNLMTGETVQEQVDMVILSTGMEPQDDQQAIASTFGISLSPDGFFLEKHPKLAPVDTATAGVFLAGTCQGPKDIPDSVAQASAAAASALALMDAGSVSLEPFTAYINAERCSGCQICVDTCPFHAIELVQLNGHKVSQVNEIICKGCGTCVAACPSGAAVQNGFTNQQIFAELDGILVQNATLEMVV